MKKLLVVGVIGLFLGLACAPSFHAKLNNISTNDKNNVDLHEETKWISCKYFTLKGVEEVEKEISITEFDYFLQLMDSSDIDAIAYNLHKLGLLPNNIPIQQAKDLISGRYGKQLFSEVQEEIKSTFLLESDGKRNIFCSISGDAVDNELTTPFVWLLMCAFIIPGLSLMLLDLHLRQYPWYPQYGDYMFHYGPFFVLGILIALFGGYIGSLFSLFPIKALPFSFAILEDPTSAPYEYPNVNTSGLLGQWWMHNRYIILSMIGFFGLWINYIDRINDFACKFRGFAFYVDAKGYDDW